MRQVSVPAAMVMPPRWLAEAHEIIRLVQLPKFPPRVVRLEPPAGDARGAIQDALVDLEHKGGGRVSLAPGAWRLEGPLRLRSRVELHLEKGAIITFSGDRSRYLPPVLTRWEGTELYGYCPCLYGHEVHDVAITGSGILCLEQGNDFDDWRKEQNKTQPILRSMGARGVPVEQRVFAQGNFLRPSFIQFFRSRNILVEGVQVGPIPFWGVHLVYSHHATIRGITVESNQINNDGVDIDSSSRVIVEQCTFRTGDDCIAIKAGRDLDGRTIGIPSENVVVRDCSMRYSKAAGVAIGSEMSGGVRGVYIFRCDMGKVETAINIKSNLDRGGFVELVRVWNVTIRECARALQVTTSYHGYMGGQFPPRFDDIEVDDLRCQKAKEAISVRGVAQSPVRRLRLKNVAITTAKVPTAIQHAEALLCEGVEINGKQLTAQCGGKAA
jgi:polygalacturonase